jgi:hypothetical protein
MAAVDLSFVLLRGGQCRKTRPRASVTAGQGQADIGRQCYYADRGSSDEPGVIAASEASWRPG